MIDCFFSYQKILCDWGPAWYEPNFVTPRPLPKNKKRDDFIFRDAFQDLLRITPGIFQETVVGDLGLRVSARAMGESVSRKKETIGLIQYRVIWS